MRVSLAVALLQDVTYTQALCRAVQEGEKVASEMTRKRLDACPSALRTLLRGTSSASTVDGTSSCPVSLKCDGGCVAVGGEGGASDMLGMMGITKGQSLPCFPGGPIPCIPASVSAADAPEPDADPRGVGPCGAASPASARTRTRTNVSLPTGTLAAERGVWRGVPWRLWPGHQTHGAALLEACSASAVAVPEAAPLRQGLSALAGRGGQRGVSRGDSSVMALLNAADPPQKPSVSVNAVGKRMSAGAAGVGVRGRRGLERAEGAGKRALSAPAGGGGGVRARTCAEAEVSRTRLSCSPPPNSSKGMGGAGAVLVGAAHKRRRQDAVAASSS